MCPDNSQLAEFSWSLMIINKHGYANEVFYGDGTRKKRIYNCAYLMYGPLEPWTNKIWLPGDIGLVNKSAFNINLEPLRQVAPYSNIQV